MPHAENAQGLIVSPFNDLDHGVALLLELPNAPPGMPACGGAWLSSLRGIVPVTPAVKPTDEGKKSHAPSVAIAFTSTGLKAMGLDNDCLGTFAAPFVEGMRQIDRRRRLGDNKDSAIDGGPEWSGNAQDLFKPDPKTEPTTPVSDPDPMAQPASTPTTVHAALLLYHRNEQKLLKLRDDVEACMTRFNVIVRRKIRMTLLRDKQGVIREHFGFVDGVSQPIPFGAGIISYGAGAKQKPDTLHAVAAGDILIGLQNADLEPAPGPFVSVSHSGAQDLPVGKAPYGYRDLGQDGSYLVIRELHQDFKGFWDSMKAEAEALGAPDHDDKWLAARVVGRTLDGDPLAPEGDPKFPGGIIAGDGDAPANDFRYFDDDHDGMGCPLGSHIRRANPRDGLAPVPEDKDVFLHVSNNHRILRRGRKFGPPYREDPSAKRGLLFMALNTDIARQFEFIQQNWMLNRDFAVLYDETDPLVGPASKFTVPMTPLRARVNVKTFVRLAGGDYFFLPSLAALDFLEKLP